MCVCVCQRDGRVLVRAPTAHSYSFPFPPPQGAPDVFFETRSVVEADIFQSLFVKFTQTPQFSELRKRSPQLLRSWRDRLSAERSNAKRVVVATRRVSSLLASPLPAEDEFVMVTPGMCTPTVPAVPPMFRPQGRVAAQLRQLAAAASASSPAAGREAEAEGPSRHYSRSENEDFYLTTFCNGVAVDRGTPPFPPLWLRAVACFFLLCAFCLCLHDLAVVFSPFTTPRRPARHHVRV